MRTIIKKVALLGVAAVLGMSLSNCSSDDGDDAGNNNVVPGSSSSADPESGVSFESFAPRSILVENGTNKRLVAFKGSITPNNLISGIPEYATNHGLKKEGIFTSTGDFALIIITEEAYNEHKNNLPAAPIFAELYAFYNHEADNNNVFKISSKAGGNGRIILNNPTPWNIEIRKDGPTGEVLGYVAANIMNTTLRLEAPADYDLFPVFKRYNPNDKEIYEVVPKYRTGNELLIGKPFMQSFGLGDEPRTWNFAELAALQNFSISSGGFYLRIQNDAGTDIRFYRGGVPVETSVGMSYIPQATTQLYSVKVARNPDGTYPEETVVSAGYSIGTSQLPFPLPERAYKTDYIYTIRVTGATAAELVIGEVQESAEPMDLEAKFGLK